MEESFVDVQLRWKLQYGGRAIKRCFSCGKNRAVLRKFILVVKHPLYVHNIPLSTIRRWNLTFHIILSFSLIVASLLHGHVEHLSTSRWPSCRWSCTIFVNDIIWSVFHAYILQRSGGMLKAPRVSLPCMAPCRGLAKGSRWVISCSTILLWVVST